MNRREYDKETKAAVMGALLAGQSVSAVADEFEIPRSTIANWSAKLNQAGVPDVPSEKKAEIGELILANLQDVLTTQAAMNRVFSEPEWLRQQSASELAVLYGVLDDKKYRLLQMLSPNVAND